MDIVVLDRDTREPLTEQREPLVGDLVQKVIEYDEQGKPKIYINIDYVETVENTVPIINITTAVYIKDAATYELKNSANVGDIIEFNATFSDTSLNSERVEISIVDRDGKHKLNAALSVTSGYGEGSFVVTEPIDYCLKNEAINHHRDKINAELVLDKEHVIRVS